MLPLQGNNYASSKATKASMNKTRTFSLFRCNKLDSISMNNTENSISQMILDQQLLSAYSSGVVNAQLRSLYPSASFGLLSTTDEVVLPTLTDSYILQALMPSMAPQEQLLTRLELLQKSMNPSTPLYSPSVQSTSISDFISALGSNSLNNALLLNNSRSSILSPDTSLIHNGQNRFGSLLQSGLGSLLPSSDQILLSNSINSLATKILEEKKHQELLNALTVASIGLPLNDGQNIVSDALNFIQKRQADASLPPEHPKKKARMTERTDVLNRSEEFLSLSKGSSRRDKKKKSKQIKKSKKENLPESTTSVTFEDAQLLFDTFATLASADRTTLKSSSTVSVDSEGSILKYEDFATNSELTSPELWDTVPKILSISMAQMSLTRMKPSGNTDHTSNSCELGQAALCCRHCNGVIGFGSHFFRSLRQGNHIHRIMKHVQNECPSCPENIQSAVQKLCKPINSDSLGLKLPKSFKSKAFFEYIWIQLCIAGFVNDQTSDSDADTTKTDSVTHKMDEE